MSDEEAVMISDLGFGRRGTAEAIAARLRELIQSGELAPGDKLPPERDLAKTLGVSRPTLRAGIRSLSAVGILRSRQGAGTFVADASGSPTLDSSPFEMLAALHGITRDELFEALVVLETSIAGTAAARANVEHLKVLTEEIAGMQASLNDRPQYDLHEVQFRQAITNASGNRVIATLASMVGSVMGEAGEPPEASDHRKLSLGRLEEIYNAIRSSDPEAASEGMRQYLSERRDTRAG